MVELVIWYWGLADTEIIYVRVNDWFFLFDR